MPKLKPSSTEVMNNEVRASLAAARERKSLTIPSMAKCMGMCRTSYDKKFRSPEKMSLGEFRTLVKFTNPTDDQILKMVRES